eukprot:CAMPEP_0202824400 /NCGR_PEP_ID=MMETSP1389-20130828/12323_1 /ASSEMBLY_ACC=CAM_ASM_000865 /TAXON_ID=302021 /ORGANISM="Rhodomonas sp., Strain CCMP768" /LENGTH=76 /DNA_ID=CAMNT_0049497487 /DNA_START=6 /DNA_END=233 /DNA_ORIENTATION=-
MSESTSTALAMVAGMGIAAGIGAAAFLVGQKMAAGANVSTRAGASNCLEELQRRPSHGNSAPRVSDIGKYMFESTM